MADGIREVLSCYTQKMDKELMEDEKRVLKVILLLQAISERMSGNRDIFLPNNKNLTLAFEGTDLEFTAQNIAKKTFERPCSNQNAFDWRCILVLLQKHGTKRRPGSVHCSG